MGMLFILILIILNICSFVWYYEEIKISNTILVGGIVNMIFITFMCYRAVVRFRWLFPMVLDLLTNCQTKEIEIYVKNTFSIKYDTKHKYCEEITTKMHNGKNLTCFEGENCNVKIEKGFYYTAVVTKYSNTVVSLTKGKKTKGNWS